MAEEQEIPDEEQELYEHYRIVAGKKQLFLRVDKFLMNHIEGASRTRIQNSADANCIQVNGKPVKSSYKVKPGDLIQVLFSKPPREIELIAQNIPINIAYEDDDFIIVNKEAGMVVHPGFGNYEGTLVNALMFHLQNLPATAQGNEKRQANLPVKKNTNPEINEALRPGLVHRIDKNTSGLMVVAKNDKVMTALAKQFFDRKVDKVYWALVWGNFTEDAGTITGHIGRSLKNRKMMHVFPASDYGKHAVTHWKVVERLGYVTLVECTIETGRTHQIRVHMKYIGHPLFNDIEYGGDKVLKGTTFTKYKQFVENCFELLKGQALHAKSLGFTHPRTKKKTHFDSELPENFQKLLEKWRTYSAAQK